MPNRIDKNDVIKALIKWPFMSFVHTKGYWCGKCLMSRRSHDKNVAHHRCLQPQSDPNFLEMSRLLSLIPGDSGLFRIMCHTRCVYRIPIWNFDMSYSMYRKYRGNFPLENMFIFSCMFVYIINRDHLVSKWIMYTLYSFETLYT